MNACWNVLRICLVLAVLQGASASAQAPTDASTSQPTTVATTQPAVNHLRTPASAIHFFLDTVNNVDSGNERFAAALPCLDFGDMDHETVRAEGPEYVRMLAEILKRLQAAGEFDPDNEDRAAERTDRHRAVIRSRPTGARPEAHGPSWPRRAVTPAFRNGVSPTTSWSRSRAGTPTSTACSCG